MKVLVAFASRHGATRGIAERIAQRLEERGLEASVQAADRVQRADDFDAFVVGSAAYMYHWMKEATGFVRRNRALLARRPVWLFSSGPIGTDLVDDKGRDVLIASEPREFAEFREVLHPRDQRVFFGAYDPDAPPAGLADRFMQRFTRLFPSIRDAMPIGDFRDWPKIESWADGIARDLRGPSTATADHPDASRKTASSLPHADART